VTLSLTFLGGAGTVTGSKYLVEAAGMRLLVDCGLFQGHRELRERNWQKFPVPPNSIDAVLLTHAHIDHSGYVPALVRDGFKGQIYCTAGTRDLSKLLLPDSAHLMEEDAKYAARRGFSRHRPPLPLYTIENAYRALAHFHAVPFEHEVEIGDAARAIFRPAGHILGASTIELKLAGKTLVFSGDLGRYDSELMLDPATVATADYLLVESTYGGRLHDRTSPLETLAEVVARTTARGGTVIIPAFAVGRAQSLLYYLEQLRRDGRLGHVPVYLDSPMAISASELLCSHLDEHRLPKDLCDVVCETATYVREAEASKRLTMDPTPKVIISASGMATGGRVLHHLKHYAPDPRNTVLLAGFQAAGTRGAALRDGAEEVRIHGQQVPVRAEVVSLETMSAHADQADLMRWMGGFRSPPRNTFIVHGEPAGSEALSEKIEQGLGWTTTIPSHGQKIELA
jgi:metallo-beta-lactamase family protein